MKIDRNKEYWSAWLHAYLGMLNIQFTIEDSTVTEECRTAIKS